MSNKSKYSELRFSLVEGGEFVAFWPKDISAHGLEDIRKIFEFQMAAVEKSIERTPEDPA